MRSIVIASLMLAQLPLAPLAAANIDDGKIIAQQQVGTFAGARLRVNFGGPKAGKASMGVGAAGLTQSRSPEGQLSTRFSEGVQFGFSADRKLGLTVGGKPLAGRAMRAREGETADSEKDGGISTLGVIGIVAGGLLVVGGIGLALFVDAVNDASE